MPSPWGRRISSVCSPMRWRQSGERGRRLLSQPRHSAAASDDMSWERLLPPDYAVLLSQAAEPVPLSSSREELYSRLCSSILLEEGVILSMDNSSGIKCYLSARKLGITWVDDTTYWRWIPHPHSRFQVAELLEVYWFHIEGQIDCRLLSPGTRYAAYLIFKLNEVREGLDFPSQEALVQIGNLSSLHAVCLDSHLQSNTNVLRVPHRRDDHWMELEMGDFFNDDGNGGAVRMFLRQVKTMNKKSGLIIQGIEIRSKKT